MLPRLLRILSAPIIPAPQKNRTTIAVCIGLSKAKEVSREAVRYDVPTIRPLQQASVLHNAAVSKTLDEPQSKQPYPLHSYRGSTLRAQALKSGRPRQRHDCVRRKVSHTIKLSLTNELESLACRSRIFAPKLGCKTVR